VQVVRKNVGGMEGVRHAPKNVRRAGLDGYQRATLWLSTRSPVASTLASAQIH
jgi:hypothetical protein